MRSLTLGELVGKSFKRTIFILFKPFSLKKWLILLFIAFLAGAIGGSGSGGGGGRGSRSSENAEASPQYTAERQAGEEVIKQYFGEDILDKVDSEKKSSDSSYAFLWNKLQSERSGVAYALISVVVFLGLALIIFHAWLGARFRFVWFDNIVNNDASIKKPFLQYKKEGSSLFKFYLILFAIFICFLGLIAAWVYSAGTSAGVFASKVDWTFMKVLNVFILPAVVLIVWTLLSVILNVCLDHFIVPIMGIERCKFVPAWRKFSEIAKRNLKDFVLFLLMLIALGIGTAILTMIISFICILAILLLGGLLVGLPYLLIAVLLKAKLIGIIVALILGIPVAAAAIILLASVNLPFAVFFRNFSLYFISSLNCGYKPLPLEDAT